MIRKNLFWKLFALAVSLSLWAFVNAERNPQSSKTFTVTLEARNLTKGHIAEFLNAKEVTVSVQGPQRIVDGVRREDVSAWVSLPKNNGGNGSTIKTGEVFASVSGIAKNELDISVSPSTARVRTEAIRWKRLPVEVKFLSPPPLGYSYSEPEIDPPSVAVSGKTSAVSRVTKVVIGLSGEHESQTIDGVFKATAVDAKGHTVPDVDLDEEDVRLKLRFVESPATKVVIVSPSVVGQPKFPATVSRVVVSPPTVTLEGRPAVLMDLSTVSTESVQIDGAESSVTKEAAVRVPNSVRLLGRRTVRVTVEIAAQ